MKQVIAGGHNDVLSASATQYNTICGGLHWIATADEMKQIVTTPGTLSNLLIELSAAPGAGKSYTFTLIKNGAPTGVAVTISDTATTGLDTDSVAVVAGDFIQLRCVPAGTPATPIARWSVLFEGTNAKESLILGTMTLDRWGPPYYYPIMAGSPSKNTAANDTWQVIPTPGKIKNLYVKMSGASGTGAYSFTLQVNGVSTELTVNLPDPATSGSDTAHEIEVAAGDYVNLITGETGDPQATVTVWFGFTFVADTDGESLLLCGGWQTPSTGVTNYNYLVARVTAEVWGTPEADFYQGGQPTTLKKLYVMLNGDPGVGKSYLIGARVNGSTKIAVTIAGTDTTGNNVVDTWDVANFDDLNMISTPSGTPTARRVYWGLVGFIAPPVWTGKISGVTNPAKVMGVDVVNIAKVKGVA